jgi:ribosomal protein L11 methyltransferase
MADFIQVSFHGNAALREMGIAVLSEFGFDTFQELEDVVYACGPGHEIHVDEVQEMLDSIPAFEQVSFQWQELQKENWNALWESQFQPVVVDERCFIYAPFHQVDKEYPLMLEIMPQMSFGTGHHPTTAGIISLMMKTDFQHKSVMDAGSGTGILAIAAKKLGAAYIFGFDVDPWSVENGIENAKRNLIDDFDLKLGGIEVVSGKYDVILANINRNVLLQQIPTYLKSLNNHGIIFFSGFYESDWQDLHVLLPEGKMEYQLNDGWMAVKYSL